MDNLEELDFLTDIHKEQTEIALEQFIEMCRYKQAQWDIGEIKESGVDCLLEVYKQGVIDEEMYVNILKVVLNPTAKYEITVK